MSRMKIASNPSPGLPDRLVVGLVQRHSRLQRAVRDRGRELEPHQRRHRRKPGVLGLRLLLDGLPALLLQAGVARLVGPPLDGGGRAVPEDLGRGQGVTGARGR